MELIIISGLSGGGKSRAAAFLEDMKYYCVDNMPISLIPKFAELCIATTGRYDKVALVCDIRSVVNEKDLIDAADYIKKLGCNVKILFMQANDSIILQRYKETRRVHPLQDNTTSLSSAISMEREKMEPIKEFSDYVIDTSLLTLSDLRRRLASIFDSELTPKSISVDIVSFGFKYGLPIGSDLVFDVRFLPNPYYVPSLKTLTGKDIEVQKYVFDYEISQQFLNKVVELISFLLPLYVEEGKKRLMISFGCTGGKHRSVATATEFERKIKQLGYSVTHFDRDIDR